MEAERRVSIRGKFGLHLRAAGRFAEVANGFRADVFVTMGGRQVDGKSILDMLSLGATAGSELLIHTQGEDAEDALHALLDLFDDTQSTQEEPRAHGD